MGDRGRAVVLQHAGVVVGNAAVPVPSRRHAAGADDRAGIGKGVGQRMDEDQLRAADADDVARLQEVVAHDPLGADHRAVAAIEVAEHPLPAGKEDFDVVAAATIVFEDDLVGRRTADGRRLSGDEPEDVAPLSTFANDEISEFRHGRFCTV